MNRLQLFEEMYEMSTHNLLCYSKDYLMTKPKPQFIKEWKREHEKVEVLKEIIAEEKLKTETNSKDFTIDQILKMYPNVQYYVRSSGGELLAGTVEFRDAKKYADQYKNECLNNPFKKHLGALVYDKAGKNVYIAAKTKDSIKRENEEEFGG